MLKKLRQENQLTSLQERISLREQRNLEEAGKEQKCKHCCWGMWGFIVRIFQILIVI